MDKVYLNQSALRIRLNTFQELSEATVTQIKYRDPNGNTGTWNATVDSSDTAWLYYDLVLNPLDLNNLGIWTVWAYVTFSDLRSAAGEPYPFRVFAEGK